MSGLLVVVIVGFTLVVSALIALYDRYERTSRQSCPCAECSLRGES